MSLGGELYFGAAVATLSLRVPLPRLWVRVYRLYIDEVGNDSLKSAEDPKEQYLCLLGVVLDLDYASGAFTTAMNDLKLAVFGNPKVILHRRELLKKFPAPYDALNDKLVQEVFDVFILKLIKESKYVAISVMIDKKALLAKYAWQANPYHYCIMALVERYINWLNDVNGVGDVMAEAREKKANKKLSAAYKYLYKHGTRASTTARLVHTPEQVQTRLTSGEIKFKAKEANIAGLQLADLLASPARRSLICYVERVKMNDGFGKKIATILLRRKYRRAAWPPYALLGYGVKLLP